ncbi:MAG TPA: hypothetical protein VH912_24210 [Streptosporangiaceae bacterium]|jgi:hypothetical protein
MSALLIVLIAASAASWAGLAAQRYHRDRRDTQWADDTVRWLRSMRPDQDFDDHCDRVLAIVSDDQLEQRRLDQAIRHHPAGGTR